MATKMFIQRDAEQSSVRGTTTSTKLSSSVSEVSPKTMVEALQLAAQLHDQLMSSTTKEAFVSIV